MLNRFPCRLSRLHGSYVEAHEEPVHHHIIDRLWSTPSGELDYFPYSRPETMSVNLDPDFESRLDALIQPQERVALLLGLVNAVLKNSQYAGDDEEPGSTQKGPRLHLLARKPNLPGDKGVPEQADDCTEALKDKIPSISSNVELHPSEADCVRDAVCNIMQRSERRYREDKNGSSGLSDTEHDSEEFDSDDLESDGLDAGDLDTDEIGSDYSD